jgi:surfactin synthase thioesterase subunit
VVPEQSPWLDWVRASDDPALTLFCFPYAGGAAHVFRGWRHGLPEAVDVAAIALPRRGRRLHEPEVEPLERVADQVAAAIEPLLERPYALFGHSLGALLAFETARALRPRGCPPPARLFVSGARAPHGARPAEPIHALPERDFVTRVAELGGTPDEVLRDADLMRVLLPALRSDFRLYEGYAFQESRPLGTPITAFAGRADRTADLHALEQWFHHTVGRFDVRSFDGDHFFVASREREVVAAVARELEPALEGVPA